MGMAVFAYAVATVLLCAAVWRSRSRFALFLLHFAPCLFLFGFLWLTQEGYRTVQVQKLGYEFEKTGTDYRQPARAVSIGGDRQKDDLYRKELPPQAVRVTPSLQDSSFEVESLKAGLLIERNGELLNSVELRDGDTVETEKRQFVFRGGGSRQRALAAADRVWEWPRKEWRSARWRRPDVAGSLQEQFYALAEISRQVEMPVQSGAVLGLKSFHLEWSRHPLRRNSVFLSAYDAAVTINRRPLPLRWTCAGGDRLRFFTLENGGGVLRARHVASFVVQNREFLAFLDLNPQTLGMREELLQMTDGKDARRMGGGATPLLLTTTTLPYSAFPTIAYTDESARFGGIVAFAQPFHAPQQENAFHALWREMMETLRMDVPRFEVVTEAGTFRPAAGERIALGETDRMLFTLDRARFPWTMLNIVLIFILLKSMFHAPVFRAIENHAAALLLPLVDFFLTLRLLFAFRASALYPFSNEAVPLALLALLVVPYLLFAATLLWRADWQRAHAMQFAAYTLLMMILGAYLLPAYRWLVIAVGFVAGAAAFLMRHPNSPLRKNPQPLNALLNLPPEAYLIALTAFALLMRMAGAGEAIHIGGVRLPLALLYHPLLLWLAARVLIDLRRKLVLRQDLSFSGAVAAAARVMLVVGVFFFISFLASDFGFFLLYCVPILFLLFGIGVAYVAEYELRWKAAGLLMAAPVLGVILLFSSYSTINRILPEGVLNSSAVQRILLAVDPQSLEETGLVAAEKQLGHQRMFLAYSRSGWNGGGYGKRPISPALASTALNDNAPSVFLMNDFGAAGFAAVCLALIAMAWLWTRALSTQPQSPGMPISTPVMMSLAALVTWVYAALYMMLANCGILLFTGKNVFLWGLNSTSDLFHSLVLLAFLIAPIAQTSEQAAAQRVDAPAEESTAVVGELV